METNKQKHWFAISISVALLFVFVVLAGQFVVLPRLKCQRQLDQFNHLYKRVIAARLGEDAAPLNGRKIITRQGIRNGKEIREFVNLLSGAISECIAIEEQMQRSGCVKQAKEVAIMRFVLDDIQKNYIDDWLNSLDKVERRVRE